MKYRYAIDSTSASIAGPAMQHSQTHLRTRPISAGHLRAFDAVARHLNFRAAAEEMALTQSAVSRQIQALEEEVGVSLFLRHTRAVELTSAGAQLLMAVSQSLPRIDGAVRQIRQSAGRRAVALTTFASFASMWLIPRLEQFQRDNPDIDIRIDATDSALDLEVADVDLALRYGPMAAMPPQAIRLFGEQLTPVVSPWLLKGGQTLTKPADVAHFALIEAGDAHQTHLEWLTWRRWFDEHGLNRLQPKRWLYFNYAYQMVQAALSGQGVVLARLPLVAGKPGEWRPGRAAAQAAHGFAHGLLAARGTAQRAAAGDPRLLRLADDAKPDHAADHREVPDPDTVDNID
jgi:DNA-binding transcriptional LysR family regulator